MCYADDLAHINGECQTTDRMEKIGMGNLILNCRAAFSTKIGRCERCMRQSLFLCLGMWGIAGIFSMAWPNGVIHILSVGLAVGLTALWMMHVVAYANRAVITATKKIGNQTGRRHALMTLTRAVGVGLVVSVPAILWSTEVFAFCGQCTHNDDCGDGWSCKNTAAVNSGEVCNECVQD